MADTLFSHDLRILTCVRCGAPIEAQVAGGSFSCGFCGAENRLARRDESADLSAAEAAMATTVSEAERHARLREQDSRPLALPADIDALTRGGSLASDRVEVATELWRNLRTQVGAGAPFATSERLFHLTLLLAPHLDARKRRAFLETAIEILEDAGHRQVLRGALARGAILAGDLDAAVSWLAPVNPRATDLAMDTAYRYAAAMLATARGDQGRVTELLGWSQTDVPLADADEVGCAILRANVLEQQGRVDAAAAELHAVLEAHGKAALRYELAMMARLSPAKGSAAQVLAQHDALERQQIKAGIDEQKKHLEALETPAWHPSNVLGALFLGCVIALPLAGPWSCAAVPGADLDPWLGPHAKLFCPSICDGCTGPYTYLSYHTSGSGGDSDTLNVYCNDPNGVVASMHGNWMELINHQQENAVFELPGGGFTLWITTVPCFVPVGFLGWVAYRARSGRNRGEQARRLRATIAEAERRLAAVGT
jgi:hypothetical protein